MRPFEFFNVEACHFAADRFDWGMDLRRMDVRPATDGRPANFSEVRQAGDFLGNFAERNPLNVPGPFYGAETDTCETGVIEAPSNVLLDSNGQEFIFRQPENCTELKAVILAAACDPFVGYGADGNDHWSLPLIREWWRDRAAAMEWVGQSLTELNRHRAVPPGLQPRVVALRAFRQYLEEGVEAYLRAYAFFLLEKRAPQAADVLPEMR
jgi:hypothetical protein